MDRGRKDAGLCCGSRLRKGEVFAYVGSIQNLKDLKWLQEGQSMRTEGRQCLQFRMDGPVHACITLIQIEILLSEQV